MADSTLPPSLTITITGDEGLSPGCPPIKIEIPRQLSLRVAMMYVLELSVKELKRVLRDLLKAQGFK